MSLIAPKAKQLYEEFCAKVWRENPEEELRTFEELSEGEQNEWKGWAGEETEPLHGEGQPMHHPPIAKQGEKGQDGATD